MSNLSPPSTKFCLVSFPRKHVMLVTLNRPKQLNCISIDGHWELDTLWKWYDKEPELRVAVLTGNGKAFCAGADLKDWNEQFASNRTARDRAEPVNKFGGMSRRIGRKPIIAAVNGFCFGGGTEMIINCDMVIASKSAIFGLPEVKRGVSASSGALPRLIRNIGLQRASEMALLGRNVLPEQALSWGLINKIVDDGQVVDEALNWAEEIVQNSPDSVVATRAGLLGGWEAGSVEDAVRIYHEREMPILDAGENIKEGLKAFVEKRKPVWKGSKI